MDSFGTKQTKCTPHGDTEPREEDNSSKAIDGTSTTSSEDKLMAKPEQQEQQADDAGSAKSQKSNEEGNNSEGSLVIEQISKDIVDIVNSSDHVPFIGVAGAGASGKSFFCQEIKRILQEEYQIEALVLPMDGYHFYRHELDKMEDPVHAHARRGAEFTFDAYKFVKDVKAGFENGKGSFPDFDHAKKDPEQDKILFDKQNQKVVLVEGLYVLLDKDPWSKLRDIFSKTFFLDTVDHLIVSRHKHRMTTKMGLTMEEAEERIFGNDMVNAQFIKQNTTMDHHRVLQLES